MADPDPLSFVNKIYLLLKVVCLDTFRDVAHGPCQQ